MIEYMKFVTKNMKYRNRNADGYNALLGTARAVKDKLLSILTTVKTSGLKPTFMAQRSIAILEPLLRLI